MMSYLFRYKNNRGKSVYQPPRKGLNTQNGCKPKMDCFLIQVLLLISFVFFYRNCFNCEQVRADLSKAQCVSIGSASGHYLS